MSRWRSFVILFFLIAPILCFIGVGGWALWETGRLIWLWLVLPAGWAIALLLAKLWGERILPLKPQEPEPELHWTPRDRKAWEFVDARIRAAAEVDPEDFTKLQFYVDVSKELAEEIARHYHPKATDPLSSLTVPEILAAGQLALEDLSEQYDSYVPGGHMLTIRNMRSLAKLPKRYKLVANIATAAAALFNPLAALGRYAASKTVMEPVTRAMQANVLTWFYTLFLQRAGFYLIEMNSGRLRGGSKRFREAFERLKKAGKRPWDRTDDSTLVPVPSDGRDEARDEESKSGGVDGKDSSSPHPAHPSSVKSSEGQVETATAPPPELRSDNQDITVCVLGQAGSGKTSVIRGVLDDADAEPERLTKSSVTVHRLQLPGTEERLRFLDTPGYGGEGDSKSARKERYRLVADSDLVLLVASAVSPARDVDVDFLRDMTAWFESQPQLKPPAIIAVLTHIDLLKPAMTWSPPYNWREPGELKEESIRDAVEHVRGEFGSIVADAVPVCSDVTGGRAFGLREWLEPAIIEALKEARACNALRHFHEDLDTGKFTRVLDQVWNIGKALRGK
jgi:uncharacterized protein